MEISGAVIAGGKSKRMGIDKASIIFQKESFLQRSVALLENFTRQIFISSNQDLSHPIYPALKDEIKNIGPIGGVYSILKQIKTQQVLIIPVDMPLLNQNIIDHLMKHAKNDRLINIFETKKNIQMLVGIYDRKLLPILEKQIQDGNYQLRKLLQETVVNLIDGEQFEPLFVNINTLNDLEIIKQQHED